MDKKGEIFKVIFEREHHGAAELISPICAGPKRYY